MACGYIVSDSVQHFESVHLRHHYIGYYDVRNVSGKDLQCFFSVIRPQYPVLFAEYAGDVPVHFLAVLDYEQRIGLSVLSRIVQPVRDKLEGILDSPVVFLYFIGSYAFR